MMPAPGRVRHLDFPQVAGHPCYVVQDRLSSAVKETRGGQDFDRD